MKKIMFKFLIIFMIIISTVLSIAACGQSGSAGDLQQAIKDGKSIVTYWGYANEDEAEAIRNSIKSYNNSNADNIYVDYQVKPSGDYVDLIERINTGTKGPDIVLMGDRYIKRWSKMDILTNLQPYVDNSNLDLSNMWDSAVWRNRYNPTLNTNNLTDPLYALPRDIKPTGLFYNESLFKKHGIKLISVDETDLAAFNAGAADRNGNTKASLGIDVNVPAKGFVRDNPYIKGTVWQSPAYGSDNKIAENIIFNNRIAMSWDEIEDLAMIFTAGYNNKLTSSDSKWGYYTEWWFSYGWSVGGDCAVDTTGSGDWTFTLGDKTKKCLLYNADGSYATDAGGKAIFVTEADTAAYSTSDGQYFGAALPSQYEAFERFYMLSKPKQYGGLGIAMRQVGDIGTSSAETFFQNGDVAMLVQYNGNVNDFRKKIGNQFDWDVAPLPVYKEYNANGTVKNNGIEIGHSGCNSMGIWKKSANKDDAFKVLTYMSAGQFQNDLAKTGLIMPNNISAAGADYVEYSLSSGKPPKNISIFARLATNQRPGDWWYMPDNEWIDIWATPLNIQYRENDKSLETFFATYTAPTNAKLASYKNGN